MSSPNPKGRVQRQRCLGCGASASLSVEQRRAVERIASQLYVQRSSESVANALRSLRITRNAALGIGKQDGKAVFGYQWIDPYQRDLFHSLEDTPFTEFDAQGNVVVPKARPAPKLSSSRFSISILSSPGSRGGGGEASATTEERYVRRPRRLSWMRVRSVRREMV